MRRLLWIVALVLSSLSLFAQEPAKKEAPPAPSAEEKAMMEAWMKASTPGAPHKALEPFIGTWDTTVKTWMTADAPPMESSGLSEHRAILGGRYIEQRFEGTFMGMPFQGVGYTGYDNIKQKYVGSWMDNMSTAVMMSYGSSEDGKNFVFMATMDDPMTGKPVDVKEKITVVDKDHISMEMWAPGPDGKVFKNMEIMYTRKK